MNFGGGWDEENCLKIFSQIVAVFACIATVNCGLVPAAVSAAYISPYASTYNAHTSKWIKVIRLVQLLNFYSTCSQPRSRHSIRFRTSQDHFALRPSCPLCVVSVCGITIRCPLRSFPLLPAVLITLCLLAIRLPKQLLPLNTSPSCTTFINEPASNKQEFLK